MMELNVELESQHIKHLNDLQEEYNASSQSETLQEILDDSEVRCTEGDELSAQLRDCQEEQDKLQRELDQQANVRQELEKLREQMETLNLTSEPKEMGVFRPFLGRIAAIYVVGIFGVFGFFAQRGLSNLLFHGWGPFLQALWSDITSPIDFISSFFFPVLTLFSLLLIVTPLLAILYTNVPESIDNQLSSLVDQVR